MEKANPPPKLSRKGRPLTKMTDMNKMRICMEGMSDNISAMDRNMAIMTTNMANMSYDMGMMNHAVTPTMNKFGSFPVSW
jgi:hypothetical protein